MTYPQSKIINEIFGEPKFQIRENGQAQYKCPKCNHYKYKLEINFKIEKFNCWTCGDFMGDVFYLVKDYGTNDQLQEYLTLSQESMFFYENNYRDKIKNLQISLPNNIENAWENSDALDYLTNRGLSLGIIKFYDLKFCYDGFYKDSIIIPNYNSKKQLNYFISRSINENAKMKYINCSFFDTITKKYVPILKKDLIFNESNINYDKTLFIVEGYFDLMSLYPLTNVTTLNGKILTKKLKEKILKHKTDIVILLDNDAIKDSDKIYNELIDYINVKQIILKEYQDINQILMQKGQNYLLNLLKTNLIN